MLVKALSRPIANAVMKVPARNTSAIVGAKSRHVSTTEKLVLAGVMGVSWVTVPVWVLLHLNEYKSKE